MENINWMLWAVTELPMGLIVFYLGLKMEGLI